MVFRLQLVAAASALACLVIVARGVSTAKSEGRTSSATPLQRTTFAANVAANEAGWRRQAEIEFPADSWSQRDAFHGHEAQSIRDLAGSAHVSYEEVIRAIDEDVHHPDRARAIERSARAVPCKPRPFYD